MAQAVRRAPRARRKPTFACKPRRRLRGQHLHQVDGAASTGRGPAQSLCNGGRRAERAARCTTGDDIPSWPNTSKLHQTPTSCLRSRRAAGGSCDGDAGSDPGIYDYVCPGTTPIDRPERSLHRRDRRPRAATTTSTGAECTKGRQRGRDPARARSIGVAKEDRDVALRRGRVSCVAFPKTQGEMSSSRQCPLPGSKAPLTEGDGGPNGMSSNKTGGACLDGHSYSVECQGVPDEGSSPVHVQRSMGRRTQDAHHRGHATTLPAALWLPAVEVV